MEKYTINELAEMLGVNRPTLRFWESQGLFSSERNEKNNYREYTDRHISEIISVLLYRNLGVPVSELRGLRQMGEGEIRSLLDRSEKELSIEFERLQNMKKSLEARKECFEILAELKDTGMRLSAPPFSYMYESRYYPGIYGDFAARAHELALLFSENRSEPVYGSISPSGGAGEQVVWEKEKRTKYMEFLMASLEDDLMENNLPTQLAAIKKAGYTPGKVVCRLLCTLMKDGKRYDYHQAWAELCSKEKPSLFKPAAAK